MSAAGGPWADALLQTHPRQPDARTCGAATLVLAHALIDEAYAERLVRGGPREWGREVWAMHRRVTSPVAVTGALQWPWTRQLGTHPWSVAAQLEGTRDLRHRTIRVRTARHRADARTAVTNATEAGFAVPLFVGTRWLPRHVVLAMRPDALYDPAVGRLRALDLDQLEAGRFTGGWAVPWWVITPRRIAPSGAHNPA